MKSGQQRRVVLDASVKHVGITDHSVVRVTVQVSVSGGGEGGSESSLPAHSPLPPAHLALQH
ncbi:hypothetical protein J6590_068199 [Homalodisca vitripennis]|nr:hypothetical protein J6590_068199 [Homalodisca vitripennis]